MDDNLKQSYLNDTLKKVLGNNDEGGVLNLDESSSGQIMENDRVKSRIEDVRKENEKTKKRDEKLKKQQEEIEKEKKKQERLRIPRAIGKFLLSIVSLNTYSNLLLSMENLLFILFIDGLLIFLLFSLLFISYIIITANSSDNISLLCFKLAGAVLISVICIIAQLNSPKPNNMNKSEAEGE